MAIRWSEFKANFKHYCDILNDDEPIVLVRREAKRRAANKEKRHRIVFSTDEQGYREFHTQKERIMGVLNENPTIFALWLAEVMESWSDEMILRWKEAHEQETRPF